MIAKTQYKLNADDLNTVLAMCRGGTLAAAGERLGVDGSTVFRALQRIERGLGQELFARTRSGYQPVELAQALAGYAEQMEVQLEAARSAAQQKPEQVSGTVRITTTDMILYRLLMPALKPLQQTHPLLRYELNTGNEIANLTRREADIALRATRKPSPHLVGKRIGALHVALFAPRRGPVRNFDDVLAGKGAWVGLDESLPDHPTVRWRRKHFPKVVPGYMVNSVNSVLELIGQGMGIGALPVYAARSVAGLRQITDPIEECHNELWLLTHPESRHLRRVSAVYGHLARVLSLEDV